MSQENSKGVWRDELWTLRSSEAEELIFAPLVSQIRESHLVTPYNVPIGVPPGGPGAHPEKSALALDGRLRQTLAKEGVVDAQKHTGILFFVVERSQVEDEANMVLEVVPWEYSVDIEMPLKKRKKQSVQWNDQDLPSLSILVNKKAIKEHTRLVVHQAIPKRQSGEGRASEA